MLTDLMEEVRTRLLTKVSVAKVANLHTMPLWYGAQGARLTTKQCDTNGQCSAAVVQTLTAQQLPQLAHAQLLEPLAVLVLVHFPLALALNAL